jgi:sugar-phosphatase
MLVTSDDVTHGKPDPEPYLKGAKQLGFAPADCLVIEDAPAGIESARAGGMKVIGMTSTYIAEKLAHADWVVSGFSSIKINANGTGKLVVEIGKRIPTR